MGTLGNAVYTIFKRPFLVLFLALIMPIICIIEYFALSLLFTVSAIGTGNIFESVVNLFQILIDLLFNPSTALKMLFYLILTVAVISILTGFILSGYLTVINKTLEGNPREKGEFLKGAQKYFYKISFINCKVLLLGIIFFAFIMVITIPALIITRSTDMSKIGFVASTAFLDIITFIVCFFGAMFFRLYILFWYPAVFNFEKKPFSIGKRVVDNYFWQIAGQFIIFDLVFTIYQMIFVFADYSFVKHGTGNIVLTALLFIVNWIFKTAFATVFITYVFSAFKMFSGNIKE
jgi:hypothetical protein